MNSLLLHISRPAVACVSTFALSNGQDYAKRYSATVSSAQSPMLEIIEDGRNGTVSDLSKTEIQKTKPSPVITTAANVATLKTLSKQTLDDLYGRRGAAGIANWKRFALLNDYLRGFRLGELTVLTGPTGSGKTTFLSEYSLDLAEQGINTLWCNFELKNSRLCSMMVRQYYSKISNPLDPGTTNPNVMERMIEMMHQKVPIMFTTFTGTTNVDTVISTITQQHRLNPLQHVIVDNLQFMMGVATTVNAYSAQDACYSKFRKLASEFNIHVSMVIHPRKLAHSDTDQELTVHSLYGGVKASQEADNILLIQVRRNEEVGFMKYLQIVKNRYYGDVYFGDRMQLSFHKDCHRHSLTWKKAEWPTKSGDRSSGKWTKEKS